jgi:REP element-mobilizing transposase RayT
MMADTLPRFGFRYHAYCLMGNHYHLLVETPNANLSKGMHWLNGVYAARFNIAHQVDGHLFQDRYWASPVAGAKAIIEVARYIAANPLRAGLCDRAELWPWSTYPMALGITPRPSHVTFDLIMGLFDAHLGIDGARGRFRRLVEQEPPARPLLAAVLPDLAAARGAGYSLREIGAGGRPRPVDRHAPTARRQRIQTVFAVTGAAGAQADSSPTLSTAWNCTT